MESGELLERLKDLQYKTELFRTEINRMESPSVIAKKNEKIAKQNKMIRELKYQAKERVD
jgi:lipid II:glycine glycyltransferase (peptidoglycan interpeptide bridge formation enzyme)